MNADPVLWENYEQIMENKCSFGEKKYAVTIDEKVNVLLENIENAVMRIFPKKSQKPRKKDISKHVKNCLGKKVD